MINCQLPPPNKEFLGDIWMKTFYVLTLALSLSSCMTYDPYTGEQKVADTTTGAIIGGITGAVLGNQIRGNRKTRNNSMIAGATIGALAGSAIGNRMDKQEADLRHKLQNSGVGVIRQGDQIVLRMPSNITFDTGSAVIRSDFEEVLISVSLVLKKYKNDIEVSGHTDNIGSVTVNQFLSQQRADSVASFLRQKAVLASRIHAVGYGKSRPISNDNSQNRRVEITLTAK